MSLNERLKQLRGSMSQVAFAKLVGASQSSIVNYEKGRLPDSGFIESVCNRFGVTADWLLFGVGDQKVSNMSDILEDGKKQLPEITKPQEKNLQHVGDFDELRELNRELRQALRDNADLQRQVADLRVERERLLHRIAALEQEAAASKNGVLPFPAVPAAPDVPDSSRANDADSRQPAPKASASTPIVHR